MGVSDHIRLAYTESAYASAQKRRFRCGETHHRATISDALVRAVRDAHEHEGLGYRRIAARFGLTRDEVRRLCLYRRRACVPREYQRVAQISELVMQALVYAHEREGLGYRRLAARFRLTHTTVRRLLGIGQKGSVIHHEDPAVERPAKSGEGHVWTPDRARGEGEVRQRGEDGCTLAGGSAGYPACDLS